MDRNRNLERYPEGELRPLFETTVQIIADHIGERAFRPDSALNAAVVDAVMVGVASRLSQSSISNYEDLKTKYEELALSETFKDAVTRATADKDRVEARIGAAITAFAEVT